LPGSMERTRLSRHSCFGQPGALADETISNVWVSGYLVGSTVPMYKPHKSMNRRQPSNGGAFSDS